MLKNASPTHEQEFRNFPAALPAIVQGMPCGAVATDSNCVVVYANEWLCGRLCRDRGEVVGQPASRILDAVAVHHLTQQIERGAAANDARPYTTSAVRNDETRVQLLAIPKPLRDEHGRVVGSFLLLLDVADLQDAAPFRSGDWRDELTSTATHVAASDAALRRLPANPSELAIPELQQLSLREWDVIKRLVAGARGPSIARELGISVHTVRNHLKSCYRKLDVHSQAELIEFMRRVMAS